MSVYSMIITRFLTNFVKKLLKYRYPEAQGKFIKSIGVDPDEYMYAVKCARVSDDINDEGETLSTTHGLKTREFESTQAHS